MHLKLDEVLISKEDIQEKVEELAGLISADYVGKNPLLVGVLKGAVIFLADLLRHLKIEVEMDFMAVSSYGASTKSSGVVRILKDLEASIEGRHVIIVEDIIDTGLTLSYLADNLSSRGAASLKIITLLDKPEKRKATITVDYCGFQIPDKFVVGYGLDCNEQYRYLPEIWVLAGEVE